MQKHLEFIFVGNVELLMILKGDMIKHEFEKDHLATEERKSTICYTCKWARRLTQGTEEKQSRRHETTNNIVGEKKSQKVFFTSSSEKA